jgi:hypothetical protein
MEQEKSDEVQKLEQELKQVKSELENAKRELKAAKAEDSIIKRVFSVSDLVEGRDGKEPGYALDGLIETITTVIDKDGWGKDDRSIVTKNNSLVVSNTAENMDKVEVVLAALRLN